MGGGDGAGGRGEGWAGGETAADEECIQEDTAGWGGSQHQHHTSAHVRFGRAAAEGASGGEVGRMAPRRRRRDQSGLAVACVFD